MALTATSLVVAAVTEGLQITVDETVPVTLDWRWVRDHGEDQTSFNQETRQRRVNILQADIVGAATSADITTVDGQAVVKLQWPDEPTTTWITVATLRGLLDDAPSPGAGIELWSRPETPTLSLGSVSHALTDDDTLRAWLGDVHRYGVGTLRGYDGTEAQAEALARRVGYPRATIFGTMWELAADITAHDDTAYTYEFLAPHTDGTYSHDAPGLQMFACVERDGAGGESVVVDAFAIAEDLRRERPDLFDVLATTPVPCHYIEPGVELRAERPVLRLDRHGEIAQVSVNTYDRSPMLLARDDMALFYEAYAMFDRMANEPARWMQVRLEAGDVLAIDNWRCLHGRMAYNGARRFFGCYVNHEDLESRWRLLGLD